MKKLYKKGMALALAGTMCFSLIGCGGKKAEEEEAHYFKQTYLDSVPAELANSYGSVYQYKDKIYYQSSDDDGSALTINCLDIPSGEDAVLFDVSALSSEDGHANVNSMTADDEGNLLFIADIGEPKEGSGQGYENATEEDVIKFLVEEWDEASEEDAKNSWTEYWAQEYTEEDGTVNYGKFLKEMNTEYDSTNKLIKIDGEGNKIYEEEFEKASEDIYISVNASTTDNKGNLYVAINEWDENGENDKYYINVYDADGKLTGTINDLECVDTMGRLDDETVAFCAYGEKGQEISVIDPKSCKVTDTYEVSNMNQFIPYKDGKLLSNDGTSLCIADYKKNKSEKYLKWMDYNISSSDLSSFGMLSDGRICAVVTSYNDNGSTTEIVLLEECDKSEVANIKQIKVACLWSDYEFEQKAIEFNKNHEDYHVTINQYADDSEEDWEAMLENFTTAVAADDSIDIICFDQIAQARNFASKGLLLDMYEFLDSDKDLSKDDFLPNIISACEFDGKLATIPTRFTVSTVVGKQSDVGTEPGWTVDDMKNLLESKPEGTQLFYGMTRDMALSYCLNLGYRNYVNEDKGTCNFNCQEFMDVLKFANMFPEEFEYEDDVDEAVLMNEGKVLLSSMMLGDFGELQLYEVIFNDKLTYIGYPTNEGNGAMLSLSNMYGISKNCDEKDAAWEFLREIYLPKEESEDNGYGFSTNKEAYEKYFEKAMDPEFSGGGYGWGDFEVDVKAPSQEMVDEVKTLIENTTAVEGESGQEMINIINEEAAYYFNGEQSVESVVEKIQSRMEIYLSETK